MSSGKIRRRDKGRILNIKYSRIEPEEPGLPNKGRAKEHYFTWHLFSVERSQERRV
jgi:hypothetical protein